MSEAGYDDMGEILTNLGVNHSSLSAVDLSNAEQSILMVNCHQKWRNDAASTAMSVLQELGAGSGSSLGDVVKGLASGVSGGSLAAFEEFISEGSAALISDYAGELLTEFTSANFDTNTQSKIITASVEDDELVELLGRQTIDLEFDLDGWYKPTSMPSGSQPLIRNQVTGDILAYKFPVSRGTVVYTAFHNHAQTTELERALLRLLVMVPIAESTGTSIKQTYTTITGDTSVQQGGDGDQRRRRGHGDDARARTVERNRAADDHRRTRRRRRRVGHRTPHRRAVGAGRSERLRRPGVGPRPAVHLGNPPGRQRAIPGNRRGEGLNSSNGTTVNGVDISDGEPREVSNGAELELAGTATVVVRVS
ncbi:FHA domain-containing protein [Haloferax gibbonsii]|uniref:FHA domain-containing protein n=1 Tax=Haloferax gibbonsii TaxID=35746 RepID=UPI0012681CFE|nr:FHA domain-containing protein [Haloferax gibbonsii]